MLNCDFAFVSSYKKILAVVLTIFTSSLTCEAAENYKKLSNEIADHSLRAHKYHISCVSNKDNVSIYQFPDKKVPYLSNGKPYPSKRGLDMLVTEIKNLAAAQFLGGKIYVSVAGGMMPLANRKTGSEHLYVLPKDWSCRLYLNNEIQSDDAF